jgi:hypothetical protein
VCLVNGVMPLLETLEILGCHRVCMAESQRPSPWLFVRSPCCHAPCTSPAQSRYPHASRRKYRAFAALYHLTGTVHVAPEDAPAQCLGYTDQCTPRYKVRHMVACFTTSGARAKSIFLLRCWLRCLHPLHTLSSARPLKDLFLLILSGTQHSPWRFRCWGSERCNPIYYSYKVRQVVRSGTSHKAP